jgi:hypothetical protein
MEQSPLFQLNLMIWLTWPAPPAGVLQPVLRQEGFTLWGIGPVFELPLDIRARAGAGDIPFQDRAGPDLMLHHEVRGLLLPIECKVSSFGPSVPAGSEKHQAQQAAALLCANGSYLADYIGLPDPAHWGACLMYAVSGEQEAATLTTLGKLRAQLLAAQIEPAPVGALGIYIQDDGIRLKPAPGSEIPVQALRTTSDEGIRVMDLEAGEDARILYLLPWDPSIGQADEYEQRVLEERIRSALTSLIGSRLDVSAFEVSLEEILEDAVEVWPVWRDKEAKAGFRNAVRAYVKQVLVELRREVSIEIHQDTFRFTQVTPQVAQAVRRYLISAAFRRGAIDLWSEGVQLDFSLLADGW